MGQGGARLAGPLRSRARARPVLRGRVDRRSVNRFFLATAQAVVPRLVPVEDLLMANSLATVGGTVALLAGVYLGGKIRRRVRLRGPRGRCGRALAVRVLDRLAIQSRPGAAHVAPGPDAHPSRASTGSSARSSATGSGGSGIPPRAIGPIASISLDQMGQGLVLTLSLVVFRERFGEGVGSFSNLIGAGGVGVLLGIATIGPLEGRFSKERIVAGAFLAGGVVLIVVSFAITGWSVLLASFAVGLTFAKIPIDTMVQEALPDGYRGRVFAAYDVAYNLVADSRPGFGHPDAAACGRGRVGRRGRCRIPAVGARPAALESVGRRRSSSGSPKAPKPRSGRARCHGEAWKNPSRSCGRGVRSRRRGTRRFPSVLQDGSMLDVSRTEPDGTWGIDREADDGTA